MIIVLCSFTPDIRPSINDVSGDVISLGSIQCWGKGSPMIPSQDQRWDQSGIYFEFHYAHWGGMGRPSITGVSTTVYG